MADFGATPQLRHPLPYASRVALPHTCKACFRLAGSAFAGRESNPLDRCERFQLVLTIILLSCSPDATGLRFASSGLRLLVMPGLVPGIHVLKMRVDSKTWMAGTSPAMTMRMVAVKDRQAY